MAGETLFVTALGWEARQVLRHLSPESPSREGRALLWRLAAREPQISVLQTGVGPELAMRAIAWAGTVLEPETVVMTGCAGALESGLAPGDVVIADEIVDGRSGRTHATNKEWRERYGAAATAASLRRRQGALYTSATILQSPDDKRSVGSRSGAIAVDMETAAIAEWAAEQGVELAAARVIVDDARTIVPPEIVAIAGPEGAPDTRRLIAALGKRPALTRELGSLGIATFRCKRALDALHRELFRAIHR